MDNVSTSHTVSSYVLVRPLAPSGYADLLCAARYSSTVCPPESQVTVADFDMLPTKHLLERRPVAEWHDLKRPGVAAGIPRSHFTSNRRRQDYLGDFDVIGSAIAEDSHATPSARLLCGQRDSEYPPCVELSLGLAPDIEKGE